MPVGDDGCGQVIDNTGSDEPLVWAGPPTVAGLEGAPVPSDRKVTAQQAAEMCRRTSAILLAVAEMLETDDG